MASNKTPPAKPLPPDALQALKAMCEAEGSNQAKVAGRLGISDASVSGALRGRYIGNVERLAERIRGELLNAMAQCPVLGEITTRICQDQREKPFSAHNPQAVRLWRACRTCPNNPKAGQQ